MPRPVAYDRDTVIRLALDTFWTEGFRNSDVDRLTRAAGVNRHSLYKAFGGKWGLYTAALRHYMENIAGEFLAVLERGPGLDAILKYFRKVSDTFSSSSAETGDRRGCFITNTAIEFGQSNDEISRLLQDYQDNAERAFFRALQRGQVDGSVRSDIDAKAVSRVLVLTGQGVSVAARSGRATRDLVRPITTMLARP